MMNLQQRYEAMKEAWSIVVSKRAENAGNAHAYGLCDRIAEHLDEEVFDLRLQVTIKTAKRAIFGL